jgi:hypothetical protein
MRLKSEIWVKAYIRRCHAAGAFAAVVARGDADAGVILVKVAHLDGTADLFAPAPAGYASDDGERRWVEVAHRIPERDADARIATERRLDSDTWIIEVEDRQGRNFLENWLADG